MALTKEQKQFAAENHRLVLKFLRQYRLDFAEWYDVIALGYLNAVQHFDERRGAFSTLAYCAMHRAWTTELGRLNRQKRRGSVLSLNELAFPDSGEVELLELLPSAERLEEEAVSRLDVLDAARRLRPRQRAILQMRASGMMQCEIAERFGVNQASISQSLKRIRGRLIGENTPGRAGKTPCRRRQLKEE